jgi:protease-4
MQITRESIFISTIRSFCNGFAIFLGILLALGLGFIAIGFFNGPDLLPAKANVTIVEDANGHRQILPPSSPAILRIDIHGTIGDMYLTAADIENILLDSREDLLQHGRVKGVLLHIDTPGGTVSDGSAIHRMLLDYKAKYKVPIFAYVDGLCASGGMYVASACDKIFATPWSLVGSVGVILPPHFNFSQAMDKWGIQAVTLTEGKDKDTFNPYRPWKPDEASSLQPVMAALYDQFVDAVTKGRPRLDKQKLIDTYGAQVFVAQTAQDYGYIDSATASYSDAIKALVSAAGISPDEQYQVVQLSPPHNMLIDLVRARSTLFQGKITHRIQLHPSLPDELCGEPLYLYLPQ